MWVIGAELAYMCESTYWTLVREAVGCLFLFGALDLQKDGHNSRSQVLSALITPYKARHKGCTYQTFLSQYLNMGYWLIPSLIACSFVLLGH